MCRRVDCSKCGRPTFAGCGAHIEQVLGDVPKAARCHCREEREKGPATTGTSDAAKATGPRSWLGRVLGK
jgi:hypothetical protein